MAKVKESPTDEVRSASSVAAEVAGGSSYRAPAGVFGYISASTGRKRFWRGPFTVEDPDVIRELAYYVEQGYLEKL